MNRQKVFSRDVLKIIAIISMFIDHFGKLFFPGTLLFVVIGRLAFPIFAFFIAEGIFYTKSIKKYICNIVIFAVISQIPYYFYTGVLYSLNILFTLVLSILVILFIKKIIVSKLKSEKAFLCVVFVACLVVMCALGLLGIIEYGIYGVILPAVFYFLRDKQVVKYLTFAAMVILRTGIKILMFGYSGFGSFVSLFAILSIVLLVFYDSSLISSRKLKYLFYWFYPIHIALLVFVNFLLG